MRPRAFLAITCLLLACPDSLQAQAAPDPLFKLQEEAIDTKNEPRARAYHFGSQGPGGIYSNHTSHTNRLVPVVVVGTKADLTAVTGSNSRYRDPEKIKALFGRLPEHTLNPEATYADQSDLYQVQRDAAARGAKYLFTVWFDGLDGPTLQAAHLAAGRPNPAQLENPGREWLTQLGLDPAVGVQFGSAVTSPTHANPPSGGQDVDAQTITGLENVLAGGYDARLGGPDSFTPGPLLAQAPGYLKGQSATDEERKALAAAGGVSHAYTDSAPSAGEYATGVKMFNNGINVADDGRVVPTLFNQLQANGWKVGTVTSVPFPHASPAAMYAHNVSRDDYQDLAREMLGLPSVIQITGRGPQLPGLDVVLGTGWGILGSESALREQGLNAVPGNNYITDADLAAIATEQGGPYVVVQRTPGKPGPEILQAAAARAASSKSRLFGFFGSPAGHLPYRTANGDFLPSRGISGTAQRYSAEVLNENPTLADMTRAALQVLAAEPGKPFALFVEPGDVDFALHDNNLDNAIGAFYSGEDAIRAILAWVSEHSNWDESVLILTADHGHYLVVDDPAAIAGTAAPVR